MIEARGAVKSALHLSGHYRRRLKRMRLPGVAVLGYHGLRDARQRPMAFANLHVSIETFAAHCRVVRELCDPISLDDWRAARAGVRPLPDRPVLITFDDGYRSVLTAGAPILRRFDLPAVVFVCSTPAADRTMLWFDAAAKAHGEAAANEMKSLDDDAFAARMAGVDARLDEPDPHSVMSPAEIAELAAVPRIEIGSHTATHRILAQATRDRQRRELADSKAALERWTGKPVSALAYPNGRPGVDYTNDAIGLARDLRFDMAFSTRPTYARPSDSSLELPRFTMVAEITAAELAHRLSYSWR